MNDRASVLIVEDNVSLGTSLEMLLESFSFEVARTTDGVGGLRNIKLMDFDVILCDFVMPEMSGDVFYLAVQRLKPELCDRFIFMSGHREDPKWAQFASSTGSAVLWKPFKVEELVNAIRGVLTKTIVEPMNPYQKTPEANRPLAPTQRQSYDWAPRDQVLSVT
jgi:CheY-like chemotaxis protein